MALGRFLSTVQVKELPLESPVGVDCVSLVVLEDWWKMRSRDAEYRASMHLVKRDRGERGSERKSLPVRMVTVCKLAASPFFSVIVTG